jgi:hypothetical protein
MHGFRPLLFGLLMSAAIGMLAWYAVALIQHLLAI